MLYRFSESNFADGGIGSRWRSEFISGLGKSNGEFIIILDIDRVFSVDEVVAIETGGADISLGEGLAESG